MRVRIFFLFTLLESVLALAWLLLIPPDPKNTALLGFSLQRWAMAGVLAAGGALSILMWAKTAAPARAARLFNFFLTRTAFWLTLAGLAATLFTTLWLIQKMEPGQLERLAPVLVWAILLAATAFTFKLAWTRGNLWNEAFAPVRRFERDFAGRVLVRTEQGLNWLRAHPGLDLALVLAAGFIPIFWNALRFPLPMGYAGLYTLMSEGIAQNGFALPWSVPYYGPGGIPFAYPPLGFYLMALALRLGAPALDYLRFAGPLFSWLCLVPMTLLGRELTGSRLAAVVASVVLASFDSLYQADSTSAGMVRAPGYLLAVLALLYFLRAIRRPGWKDTAVSAVFFALTIYTHLSYAVFFAVSVTLVVLWRLFDRRRWLAAAAVALVGLALSAPWWGMVLARYGPAALGGALNSHDNGNFLRLLEDLNRVIPWFADTLRHLLEVPLFWGLAVTGLLLAAVSGSFFLPAWLLALLVFTPGDRFVALAAALLVGLAVQRICGWLGGAALRGVLFSILAGGLIYLSGCNLIAAHRPDLSAETLQMAQFVKSSTPTQASYLAVFTPEEAEWLPYLLQRDPLAATWGAEWLGTYNQQMGAVQGAAQCEQEQSLPCLSNLFAALGKKPDLLIAHADRLELARSIDTVWQWPRIYQDGRYILWQKP